MDWRFVIKLLTALVFTFTFTLLAGCSSGGDNSSTDTIVVVRPNANPDTSTVESADAASTISGSGADTSTITSTDTADAGTDTGTDIGTDIGTDTGTDTGTDIGTDTDTDTDTDTSTDTSMDTGSDMGADIINQTVDRQINAENAETLLREVSAIVNEEPIKAFMQQWQSTFGGTGPWIDFSESGPMQEVSRGELAESVTLNYDDYWGEPATDVATEFTEHACTGGGAATGLNATSVYAHILDNCAVSSGTHSGEILRIKTFNRGDQFKGHYKNLKLVDSQQIESTLSGRFTDGPNLLGLGKGYAPGWIDVEFIGTQNNEPFALTDFTLIRSELNYYQTDFLQGSFTASIKADFEVAADWSQQAKLSVSVDVSLRDGPEAAGSTAWDTGSISVNASDGSWMKVELDTVNTSEFSIILENNEVIGPYNWVDGYLLELSRHW